MIELNAEQLNMISGGDGLTVNGGGQWQEYTGPLPLPSGGGGNGNKSILMQSDGSDGDVPRPAFWP